MLRVAACAFWDNVPKVVQKEFDSGKGLDGKDHFGRYRLLETVSMKRCAGIIYDNSKNFRYSGNIAGVRFYRRIINTTN